MPILIYTADFREKDGEVLTAADVSSNFSDLERAANGLDWENVQVNSLDTYHTALGEQPKVADGRYQTKVPFHLEQWVDLASISIPASVGDGVYAVASVAYDGAYMGIHPAFAQHSNRSKIRISSSVPALAGGSVQAGQRVHNAMDNPEVHGQGGIVFAYQVERVNGQADDANHVITLSVNVKGGSWLPGGTYLRAANEDQPTRGNLVVFLVHR